MKAKKEIKHFDRDREGIIYKYPGRRCKDCVKYPCFRGIEKAEVDFAMYGCRDYREYG